MRGRDEGGGQVGGEGKGSNFLNKKKKISDE